MECPSPSLTNPTTTTNAMEEDERKNTRREHKELQYLYPQGSPHLEEKMIGGNIDLDLLSLFPQKESRIIGGIESWQAPRGQQWWGKNLQED
jgi:hypothetical protein